MSDNTPTREQIQQALDYVAGQYADSGQHMSRDMEDIFAAARLWLEAPTDEMIKRAARAVDEFGWEIFGEGEGRGIRMRDSKDLAERVLRAALEVEHE